MACSSKLAGTPRGRSTSGSSRSLCSSALLDAALDVANGFEVLVELDAVPGADAALQRRDPVADRVEDAAVGRNLRGARGPVGAAAAAEHPLEQDPRIVFHRQRRRRPAPRDRVRIGAAEPDVARARRGRGLRSPPRARRAGSRWPSDCAISWSIDTPASTAEVSDRFGGMSVRNRVEARACTPAPVAAAGGGLLASPDSTVSFSRNGSSGFIVAGNRKPAPSCGGCPLLHHHAVRHVDDAEAERAAGRRLRGGGERRHHAVEKRQRQRGAQAAQDGAPRHRLPGDDHDSAPPHLEWCARDDADDDRRPAEAVARRLADDPAQRRPVVVLDAAAERVRHQPLGDGADELLRSARPTSTDAQPVEAFERLAVGQRSGRVDRRVALVARAQRPDGVELLEREAERIHLRMARRARRILPVLLEPLAHRLPLAVGALVAERRHVGRRRRRRRAEDVLEQPLAAQDRRRAVRVRGHRQHAAMAEQAAAVGAASWRRAGSGCRRRPECRSGARAAR